MIRKRVSSEPGQCPGEDSPCKQEHSMIEQSSIEGLGKFKNTYFQSNKK